MLEKIWFRLSLFQEAFTVQSLGVMHTIWCSASDCSTVAFSKGRHDSMSHHPLPVTWRKKETVSVDQWSRNQATTINHHLTHGWITRLFRNLETPAAPCLRRLASSAPACCWPLTAQIKIVADYGDDGVFQNIIWDSDIINSICGFVVPMFISQHISKHWDVPRNCGDFHGSSIGTFAKLLMQAVVFPDSISVDGRSKKEAITIMMDYIESSDITICWCS